MRVGCEVCSEVACSSSNNAERVFIAFCAAKRTDLYRWSVDFAGRHRTEEVERVKGIEPSLSAWEAEYRGISANPVVYLAVLKSYINQRVVKMFSVSECIR